MANTIEVKRVKNRLFPCMQCRFQNSLRFPKSQIHAIQQRWKAFLPNLRSGTDPEYIEIIGECKDFQQRT